jgi:DNA-3-methyladenine glycosylase
MDWNDPIPLPQLLASSRILPRAFYERATVEVARDLLGKVLANRETAGRIVEVEAYLGMRDAASHAFRGPTARNRVMFGPAGYAYVYFIYGMHECVNFVCEPDGVAGAVLIRALEPLSGLMRMRRRRAVARAPKDLCSGPGKLTAALGITRALNGCDVTREGQFNVRGLDREEAFAIAATPRIGITRCADWPLRFLIKGNQHVSRRE